MLFITIWAVFIWITYPVHHFIEIGSPLPLRLMQYAHTQSTMTSVMHMFWSWIQCSLYLLNHCYDPLTLSKMTWIFYELLCNLGFLFVCLCGVHECSTLWLEAGISLGFLGACFTSILRPLQRVIHRQGSFSLVKYTSFEKIKCSYFPPNTTKSIPTGISFKELTN